MTRFATFASAALLAAALAVAQAPASPHPAPPAITPPPAIPADTRGVYLHDSDARVWMRLLPERPKGMHIKDALISEMTYGAVPVPTVVVYDGAHAEMRTNDPRPVIAIVSLITPGALLVRLHGKKHTRELRAGKIRGLIFNIHVATAQQGDVLPLLRLHWGPGVDLVQPAQPLEPGEYALMFGNRNVDIASFSER